MVEQDPGYEVEGEVWAVDFDLITHVLDGVEGVHSGMYHRKLIRMSDDSLCVGYVFPHELDRSKPLVRWEV